jgi:hypothetical protein
MDLLILENQAEIMKALAQLLIRGAKEKYEYEMCDKLLMQQKKTNDVLKAMKDDNNEGEGSEAHKQ